MVQELSQDNLAELVSGNKNCYCTVFCGMVWKLQDNETETDLIASENEGVGLYC